MSRILTDLPLFTNDDFEHPNYPNQLRIKIIPDWDTAYTFQQNQYRLIAEAQHKVTARLVREETLREVGKWLSNWSNGKWKAGDFRKLLAKLSQGVMPDSNNELIMECCGKSESQCKCERE